MVYGVLVSVGLALFAGSFLGSHGGVRMVLGACAVAVFLLAALTAGGVLHG